METLTYLFWSLYKYFKRTGWRWDAYGRSLMCFSFPYSIPCMFFLFMISKEYHLQERYNISEWIILLVIFVFFMAISYYSMTFVFPKKKIESLEYTKEEIKKHRLNIIYFIIGIIVLIILRLVYVRYTK